MTAPASGRARRGRLLVVGSAELARTVRDCFVQPPVEVPDLFHAIGEVLTADAARPIVAALVADDLQEAALCTAPAALRRIDPALEVILATARGRQPEPDEYDACVDPGNAAALRRLGERLALSTTPAPSQPGPAPAAAAAPTRPAAKPEPATIPEPTPTPTPRPEPPPATAAAPATGPSTRPTTRPSPKPGAGPTAGSRLGDTDLVEAILSDPAGVGPTALRVIGQQTGLGSVRLVDDEVAPQTVAVRVSDGTTTSWLVTDDRGARVAQLQPWADWLARWLTLDASYRRHRSMAYHDDLTGAWNRRAFDRFMQDTIARAAARRQAFSVLVFDIDDFKHYNDAHGHEAGDTILRETVALLNSVIRNSDRVCRIGGDEFVVILADLDGPRTPGSTHLESTETIVRRFQTQIATMRFPKLGIDAPGALGVSAGLATYPWDAIAAPDLLRIADCRALESKRAGKSRITFGPGFREGETS